MTRKTKPTKPIEIVTDSAQFRAQCPACGAAISTQATVEKFGEPAKWDFWGRAGERWARCKGEAGGYEFVHFRAMLNGRFSERLAWIKPTPEAQPVQETLL